LNLIINIMEKMIDNPITQSIWKQTNDGNWKLFFNLNTDATSKVENETQLKLLMEGSAKKALKMGSLVMSPKGIGRLIKLDDEIATIKFLKDDLEETYEESQILSEFPIYLRILEKDFTNWYRFIVPANGNTETLKKIIEELKIVDITTSNYILIYNGTEIKEEFFFDQIDLRANAKILLCGLKMTECKLSRYTTTYNWWYTYNIDGISFSVNKKIKLAGIGLYGSHEGKTQNASIKIFEGTMTNVGQIFYDEPVDIQPAPEQNNCIKPFHFKKPINIKPHMDYTIQLISTNYCYLYYGSGGKATVEGDRGVEFYFKYTPGSSHGSGVESGNFPEIYYYA
jgi:hypothetical protein